MTILYLLGIRLFQFLIFLVSPFNEKARLWRLGRKNIFKKLKKAIQDVDSVAWFHCASLGEFEQGRPVIEMFKKRYPQYKVLLTFYSPSGYEIRKNYEKADFVFYLPLDTPLNAKKFLDAVNPKAIFFIKYEFWYFFLKEISKRSIPLYLISGIFRKGQQFFKVYGIQSRKMLSWFTHFFVQNEESQRLLQSINYNNVTVTGDTRFDRVYEITQQAEELPAIERFVENKPVIILGSSWKADEELIFEYLKESNQLFKLIIAPHEIHKENIQRIVKSIPPEKQVIKYSEAREDNILNKDILIIDNIGLLSSVYRYGSIAYIGGGFGKGIHNILEAATFGLPVMFGPNYQKFKEALDLLKLGGAICINNYNQLEFHLNKMLNDGELIDKKGEITANYVRNNQGATSKILDQIKI